MKSNLNFYDNLIGNVVKDSVYEISAKISQSREHIIMSTIQTIGGTTYEHITFDKDKVLEALSDYVGKHEQKANPKPIYTRCSEELNDKISELIDDYNKLLSKAKNWGLDIRLYPDSDSLVLYYHDDYSDTLLVDKNLSSYKKEES